LQNKSLQVVVQESNTQEQEANALVRPYKYFSDIGCFANIRCLFV